MFVPHETEILDCQAAVTGWPLGRCSSIFPQPGLRIGCDIGSVVGGKGQRCRWSTIVDCGLLMVILSEICQGKKCKHVGAWTCCLDRFCCRVTQW